MKLWDVLASRCKSKHRKIDKNELKILTGALSVHNMIWSGKKASLQYVSSGDVFDYEVHERVDMRGDSVTDVYMPGLSNAANRLQKKCLVKTK